MLYGSALTNLIENTRKTKPKRDTLKEYTDLIINQLINKGVCVINYDLFYILKDKLPQMLRGQILFHSLIETGDIFITYKKQTS